MDYRLWRTCVQRHWELCCLLSYGVHLLVRSTPNHAQFEWLWSYGRWGFSVFWSKSAPEGQSAIFSGQEWSVKWFWCTWMWVSHDTTKAISIHYVNRRGSFNCKRELPFNIYFSFYCIPPILRFPYLAVACMSIKSATLLGVKGKDSSMQSVPLRRPYLTAEWRRMAGLSRETGSAGSARPKDNVTDADDTRCEASVLD